MASIDSLSIQITASTASAKGKIDALTKSVVKLGIAIDSLDVSKFESLSRAVDSLSSGLTAINGTSVKHIKSVGKAIDTFNESSKKNTAESFAKDIDKAGTASKKTAESIQEVSNVFNNGFKSSAADELAGSLEKVQETVHRTASGMTEFKKLLAKLKIVIPTEGLEKVDKRIAQLQERIDDLKDRMDFKSKNVDGYVDSKEIEKDKEKIDGLVNELERLKLKKQELESHGGFKLNLGATISNLRKGFESVNKKLDEFVKKMHRAKSHTRDTAKATDSFKVASTKLAKELTRVTKMLKLMITRMILRKVIQNAIDGFKNLTQYSSEVDASVSLMWNSFRQLGNAVAAAVGPLINALAPALNYIIQLCIKVANAINQVISALTGRSTWTRAKTLTDDYAKSLDKSNKSAKDLKRTILGFDEINKLDDNKDSGGGGTTAPEDMFEDAKIEAKWADMAKKLRSILNQLLAPIKKAWSKLGDQVVAAWTGAFKSVKKLLSDIGRDFLKVWNQPRTIQMLETILRIFQDIGGIVKYLADGLDKAWNANHTGLKILSNIRDIFLTIVTHIRNMTAATLEWAKTLNFTPLLEAFKDWVISMKPVVDAIAGAFEDFYTQVLLPLGKWTMEKGLPELIQVFIDFNDKVRWDSLREKLSTLWQHLEPFAERVGEGLIIFIRDCSEAVANFVNSDVFQKFLERIEEWMDKVDAEDVARTIKLVAGAIIALKGALFLLEGVKGLSATVETVKSFLSAFSVGGAGASAAGAIGETASAVGELTGALTGLEGALSLGGTAMLLEQINRFRDSKAIKDVSKDFEDGKISAKEYGKALDEIKFGKVVQEGYSYKQAVLDFFNPFSDTDILGSIRKMNTELGIQGQHMNATAEQMQAYGEKMGWTAEEIDKYVKSAQGISTETNKAVSSFNGLAGAAKALQTNVNSSTEGIKRSANVITMEIPNEVANAEFQMSGSVQTLSKNFSDNMGSIDKTVSTSMDDVNKSFDKVKDGMSEENWTFSGVWEGLEKTFQKAKEAIKGVWNSIADKLNGNYDFGLSKFNIHLPRFARGGFPEDGLFMANHNELVGKFDNGRTAVANNEQITTGIANAVYSAIMSANSGGSTRYINNTIQIDGRAIARAVTVGQDDMNRRYSPVTT